MINDTQNNREYLVSLDAKKMSVIRSALSFKYTDFKYFEEKERNESLELLRELSASNTGMPSNHEWKNSPMHFPTDPSKTYLVKTKSYSNPDKEYEYLLCCLDNRCKCLFGRGVEFKVVPYDNPDLRDMLTCRDEFKWIELP